MTKEKILLIEPNYKNKYVPLGLMKISFYHKEIKGDKVWFSKGKLPKKIDRVIRRKVKSDKYHMDMYGSNIDEYLDGIDKIIEDKSWDRIYITTLFTFEYDAVIEAIDYAKSLIGDNSKIYVGGILATLMPDKLREDTGVNVLVGQLTSSSAIGYDDNVNIDILTPDYSILSNIKYEYDNSDAYYSYTTRGCGMNCGFCAVKTLEPKFVPYISIKEQIRNIDRLYGPKTDLLLMDNNILKSNKLEDIVNDLVELGFYKDAEYINPKTGRTRKRYIDFNQGLDAKLMTDKKAMLLGKLALKPGRVAFDHIEDTEIYLKAMRMLISNGTTYLSNYLLYNSDAFSGKGTMYNADTPEDLYNRLKVNVELQIEENKMRESSEVHIYSFPMRYIPLDDKKRGYVGPKWSKKTLRAIQVIVLPTRGKCVSSPSYFYNIFGETVDEFLQIIWLPEEYLKQRGLPIKNDKMSEAEFNRKVESYRRNTIRINDWKELYNSLNGSERENFELVIGNNKFDSEDYSKITSTKVAKLYLHYVTPNKLLNILRKRDCAHLAIGEHFIMDYIKNEAKYIYEDLVDYISISKNSKGSFKVISDVLTGEDVIDILDMHEKNRFENDNFYNTLSNIDEYTLYRCIHTWIRNRRLSGLRKFAVDVADVLVKSDDINIDKRSMYVKEEMLTLFKDFLEYDYPEDYKLSDKYDEYKYDLMIVDGNYDPYIMSESFRRFNEMCPDADETPDIYFDEDLFYYDDYMYFMDRYNEVH